MPLDNITRVLRCLKRICLLSLLCVVMGRCVWSTKCKQMNRPTQLKIVLNKVFLKCCVFRPAFRCLQHLRAGWNFFQLFFNLDGFCWFQPWNHWKSFKMNEKHWKTAEKTAPEGWSKYTTMRCKKQDIFEQV